MRNVLLVFAAVMLFIAASGYSWYISSYKGTNYYGKIYEEYKPVEKKVQHKGKSVTRYTYIIEGFDEKGESQELKFNTYYKIKPETYLEVFSNKNKKVTSWIAHDKSEIPRQPLEEID